MTDARIITREELLEVVQAERHKAFEDGYELGQKVACLERAEPDHKKIKLAIDPNVLTTMTGD